ncbi:H-NS family nucleoid-associated regulatory protein [Pseudorhodoferax sp. Leaf267]|uniref:H-NS histone family protein n=1 Tax=Pseudorhodoferax sp. Leaf267 TaxID=1736316 RepID=UPI0006F586C6|nr:H-NS histone family protein [Pseudorhodoferax sp. Leaf267]KQP11894.1 histone [Pseudorhodoferax sp. Leaf267]
MTTYKELLQQREALDAQIEELRRTENQAAIEKVRAIVTEYQLTEADVFGKPKATTAGQKVAPKYRDAATGATWTGRGKPPKWIEGKDRQEFLIS